MGLYFCIILERLSYKEPSEKEKVVPAHKSSKECFMVMYCANASENHKMKLIAIGKAKNQCHLKTSKQMVFLFHYNNQNGVWMDRNISENWFYRK
jgi:hypothetical protein